MDAGLFELINKTAAAGSVATFEPMKEHTTFKVGGEADVFIAPGSIEEAEEIIRLLCVNKEPFNVIGNGSNLLVSDSGIRGTVVCLKKGCDKIIADGKTIRAQAGALLSKVSALAKDCALCGLEFASGIPGSVGGAVFMNAGAYGGDMSKVIKSVKLMNLNNGETMIFTADEMKFGYRHSIAREEKYIILEAVFELDTGNVSEIKQKMDELNRQRRDKQPLEYPSAGSTFKRPEGYFAGKLIEDAGLRGYTVGGASVSEKHCGFVVNNGNATAADLVRLIKDVRDKVKENSGVLLEPEVCMLGEDIGL